MFLFIRYLKNKSVYTRLRDASGNFWDFNSLTWGATLVPACKVFLTEMQDDDTIESLYSAEESLPAGGPWIEETVNSDTGRVIGYGDTTVPIESTQLTLRQLLFGYIGNASNVFSKVCGAFTGMIDFYVSSYSSFSNSMADPAGTRVCTLASTGVMSNISSIATDGEVLYMKFSSSFSCRSAIVINIYNAVNKGNIRVYIPLGAAYVASLGAYYPTTSSGLLLYENGNLISLGETAYGKALGMIPIINWDRISQPVQLTTTAVIV
jgi:hypothetical protein